MQGNNILTIGSREIFYDSKKIHVQDIISHRAFYSVFIPNNWDSNLKLQKNQIIKIRNENKLFLNFSCDLSKKLS